MHHASPITVAAPAAHDYQAALTRVMGLADFERSVARPGHSGFHLERMALLTDRLGNPHVGLPTVHVAGTDGKGSTAAMVTSILAAAGYKTGLYTSPHLHTVTERIRVGLEPVAQSDFVGLVQEAWPAVEWVSRHGGYGGVSFFEVMTAMAFLHYRRVQVDFQVLEVGLGGRLDATNVVTPDVCTITPISLDHVATLGDTLGLIAREKAGILKPGVPVVVAPQPDEAMGAVREVARQVEAPVIDVGERFGWEARGSGIDGQYFSVLGPRRRYNLWTPLLGEHQLENAATAIATVETLVDNGHNLSSESISEGIRRVNWPARLQLLTEDGGPVVVDGAHNPASMRRLVQALQRHFSVDRTIVIFGAISGHSVRGMLNELEVLNASVVAVRSRHPKSAECSAIADSAGEAGLRVVFESPDVAHALRHALDLRGQDTLILATGSLSVAAEVTEEVRGMAPELYPNIKVPTCYR